MNFETYNKNEEATNRVGRMLAHYNDVAPSISRIEQLVQDNPTFFRAKLGQSCMGAAATKLEELVTQAKERPATGGDES